MNLADFSSILKISPEQSLVFNRVVIDSRQILPGDLFIALQGEHFDGHDFLQEVASRGAIGAIVTRSLPEVALPQWIVGDPLQTLQHMAKIHRTQMTCPSIALTGSNGKTSVKEMIASILPSPSFATLGNLNNHIGVPLSILALNAQHRYAVFELGANHLGEIAQNVAIVQPKVALINNIAPAHIGEFGSIESIARAKGEIYQGLDSHGIAVVNEDDQYAHFWDEQFDSRKVIRFSVKQQTDIYATAIHQDESGCFNFQLITPSGEVNITLQVPGLHNVRNALAAASCCEALGVELDAIAQGLNVFTGVSGRLTFLQGKHQATIIDDTYNANLRSVLAAIEVLSNRQGQKILVLGDMGELGAWAEAHHREVGEAAKAKGIHRLLTLGHYSAHASQAFGMLAQHFDAHEELAQVLQAYLDEKTTILVKGSRSAKMEKIVRELIGESQ